MDGVPLKMPQAGTHGVQQDFKVTVPDYLSILQETQFDFNLEKWVLTGLQSGFTSQQQPQFSSSSLGVQPSCPPYWMMFSSPQESRLASRHSSDFWEPNPRQRSHSLNPAILSAKFAISDSEDEGESTAKKNSTCQPEKTVSAGQSPAVLCKQNQRTANRAFVPDLLNPPACLSSLPHQRRKNLRQSSLSVPEPQKYNADSQSISLSLHMSPDTQGPNIRVNSEDMLHSIKKLNRAHKNPDSGPDSFVTVLPSSGQDSSTEVLSALSPEERELLEAITAQGYPLRTAFTALQKTGQQTPDQILSYLVASDHLCQLGYDVVQVEEALEMFQNSETKAKEFLHLLHQFNEMGFQQNTIKEVLLVHDNHRERALEELMMRIA